MKHDFKCEYHVSKIYIFFNKKKKEVKKLNPKPVPNLDGLEELHICIICANFKYENTTSYFVFFFLSKCPNLYISFSSSHFLFSFFPISGVVKKFYTIIFSLKVALSLQENQMWKFLYKKEKERGALPNWTSEFFILISNQLDSTELNLNLPHFQIH
jgi:hypothetical protein